MSKMWCTHVQCYGGMEKRRSPYLLYKNIYISTWFYYNIFMNTYTNNSVIETHNYKKLKNNKF